MAHPSFPLTLFPDLSTTGANSSLPIPPVKNTQPSSSLTEVPVRSFTEGTDLDIASQAMILFAQTATAMNNMANRL